MSRHGGICVSRSAQKDWPRQICAVVVPPKTPRAHGQGRPGTPRRAVLLSYWPVLLASSGDLLRYYHAQPGPRSLFPFPPLFSQEIAVGRALIHFSPAWAVISPVAALSWGGLTFRRSY